MIEIEMDVFSGLPNPVWDLNKVAEDDMISRILDGGLRMLPINHEVAYLGYRGFRIRARGESARKLENHGIATSFYVTSADGFDDGSNTERSLIEGSMGLQDIVGEHALERLVETAKRRSMSDIYIGTKGKEQPFDSEQADTPDGDGDNLRGSCWVAVTSNSDFSFWNNSNVTLNNCYNYASNWKNNTFAQPGRGGTGSAFWQTKSITAANCKQGCFDDGYLASNPCDGVGHWKMAVVAWPGVDFHFYRRVQSDAGGTRWADKAGQTPAKNTDHAGNIIRNPSSANRGNYTDWGGYLYRHRNVSPNIR